MAWMTKGEGEEEHENGWRCRAHLEDVWSVLLSSAQ